MIRFAVNGQDEQGDLLALGFGLRAENIKRLQEGKPIAFWMTIDEVRTKIMIFYGETEEAMRAEMAEFIGPDTIVEDAP
jgi:hypothetical protein